MYDLRFEDRNVDVLWYNDYVKPIVEMCIEHYVPHFNNVCLMVNSPPNDDTYSYIRKHPNQYYIYYNLEHKYPLYGNKPKYDSENWNNIFLTFMNYVNEVWDYNIENKDFFDINGYGDKFLFKPLRYTKWFDNFTEEHKPNFDIEFEGSFTTNTRFKLIQVLTKPSIDTGKSLKFKLANTDDVTVKYKEKQDAKYCIDLPHYNYPQTTNATRIYESVCLNKQVIVYDKWNVGSRKYFGNLCLYIDDIHDIFNIVKTEPKSNVKDIFKEWTYTDKAYNEYIQAIENDFNSIKINPDSNKIII